MNGVGGGSESEVSKEVDKKMKMKSNPRPPLLVYLVRCVECRATRPNSSISYELKRMIYTSCLFFLFPGMLLPLLLLCVCTLFWRLFTISYVLVCVSYPSTRRDFRCASTMRRSKAFG